MGRLPQSSCQRQPAPLPKTERPGTVAPTQIRKAAAGAGGTASPAREAPAEAPAHIVRGGVSGAGSPGTPNPGRGPWLLGGPAPGHPWLLGRPGPLRRCTTLPPSLPPAPRASVFLWFCPSGGCRRPSGCPSRSRRWGLAPLGPKGIGFPGPEPVSPPLPLHAIVLPSPARSSPQPSTDPRRGLVHFNPSIPTSDCGFSQPT